MKIHFTKKGIILTAAICAVLVTGLLVLLLVPDRNTKLQRINVYYFNPATSALESETRQLPNGDPAALTDAALKMLYEAPKSNILQRTMPEDMEILSASIVNGTILETTFSSQYLEMTPTEEVLFRASLIWTMTELPFIENVRVLVNGEALLNAKGALIDVEGRETVEIDPIISPKKLSTRTFTLYFVNEQISGLLPEERVTETNPDQPAERFIIEQLIAGPRLEGRFTAISPETKIRGIKTEDGICSINLSNEFVSKFNGSTALAELTLYSIVNSVMENVSSIKKIQFLIESERMEQFNGVPGFDKLFEQMVYEQP